MAMWTVNAAAAAGIDKYTRHAKVFTDSETELSESTACSRASSQERGSSCTNDSSRSSFRLVVKGTFIEIDEGPALRTSFFRRSKTDSHLLHHQKSILEGEEYVPGGVSSTVSTDDEEVGSDTTDAPEVMDVSVENFLPQPVVFPLPAHQYQRGRQQHSRKWGRAKNPEIQTTVMMRNIPNNYTRNMLLEMIDNAGFKGLYDFFYLPMDFGRCANLGYAFVNLVTPEATLNFWNVFDGFSSWEIPTAKVCELGWSAPHQGLEAHIERYRNSPVMHKTVPDEYKPMIFLSGVRQPFPPPTKHLNPPQLHLRR